MKDKTFEECIEVVRNHKLFSHGNAEDIIKHALEYQAEAPDEDNRGKTLLWMSFNDYAISEEIQVGALTVGVIGKERSGASRFDKDERIGGKYRIYKGTPDRWVKESCYHKREDILKIAAIMAEIDDNKCIDVDVEFPTGKLAIANYFYMDDDRGGKFVELPKDMKYKEEFSINNDFGVRNTANWLADNRGIAYGQLGNTSCHIYKVSDDRILIIGNDEYYIDEEGYEQEMTLPAEWEKIGDISCEVWRFEAVDKSQFEKHNFDYEAYKDDKDDEILEVAVTPGTWEMKTYYQHRSDEALIKEFGYNVYAELNRKG